MARDQEPVSLFSFEKDLLASGHVAPLSSPDSFTKETKATPRKGLTVVPEHVPTRLTGQFQLTSLVTLAAAKPAEVPEAPEQLIIGGAAVRNASLVVGDQDGLFNDLKVMPVPVAGAKSSEGSLLVAPVAEGTPTQPMLLLPAGDDSDFSFTKDSTPVSLPQLDKELKQSKEKVGAAAIDAYVLSGDIENFFGIKGLTGKLYSFKSDEDKKSEDGEKDKEGKKDRKDKKEDEDDDDQKSEQKPDEPATQSKDEKPKEEKSKEEKKEEKPEKKKNDKDTPVDEKVKLKDMESPLGILFPEIENKTIQKLPLKNLEFTFSNTEKESLFPAGLRLQGDLELKDGLQFISDGLKNVFASDKSTTLPTKIRVSAFLAEERDWSKKPKIEGMVLQAALDDMKLPTWDFLEFRTAGIELSVRKEAAKKDKNNKVEDDKKKGDKKNKDNTNEEQKEEIKDIESKSVKNAAEEDASKADSGVKEEEATAEPKDAVTKKSKASSVASETKENETKDKEDEKNKKDKKKWKVGFGLFGKLKITKVPKSKVPLEARYWIRMGDWKEEKKDKKGGEGGGDKGKDEIKAGKDDDKEKKGEKGEKKEDGEGKKKTDKAVTAGGEKKDDDGKVEKKEGKKEKKAEGGSKYELVIEVGKWKDFCAISNVDIKEAQLRAFFKPGEFRESCTLSVSGSLEFAQGSLDKKKEGEKETKNEKIEEKTEEKKEEKEEEKTKNDDKKDQPKKATLKINGQLSRKDYHFDARVGDLKLDSILKIYAQISGAEPSKEAKEHDLVFEELHLNVSRKLKKKEKEEKAKDKKTKAVEGKKEEETEKVEEGNKQVTKREEEKVEEDDKQATKKDEKKKEEEEEEESAWSFELSGKVSFNNVKSVNGLIKIDSTGLTIQGGVGDYKIPDAGVDIKEAKIDIFIGAKPDPAKVKAKDSKPKLTTGTSDEKTVDKPTDTDKDTGKSNTKDIAKKNVDKGKVAVFNRANKFAIKGKVEFSGLTVTVAFLTERKETNAKSKKAPEREWVLYGVLDGDLRLSKICKDLEGTEIGNIQLRNIALIAASGENKTVKELNTLKYPVKKGISLCATIPPLPELDSLAKQTVDGLVLAATVQQKLELRIHLPKTFDVEFTDSVKLNDIGIGIEVSRNPSLMLEGVLAIKMERDQDPLKLEGMVRAGVLSASASVATQSPWVNPFNISKEVTIADFRVELEITYATLLELGPSKIALAGDLEVGELTAGAAMAISHYPGDQVLSANISKVDLIEIIHVAGQVADIQALKDIGGGEDTFVFTDASMYISTGATIAGKEYPRGISAGGKLTAFGTNAEFDLSIGAAGLDFKGYIDNFSLGPLVVSSASGDPRASMIVLMTKDQQVIKVDGMVTFFGVGLVTLVDIQMGTETPSFNAYLAVQFTQAFEISLRATVDDFRDVKDLAAKDLYFHAQIKGDLFEVICESIKNMLKTIEELGTQGIEAVQNLIGEKVAEKQKEMDRLAQKVKEAKKNVESRRKDRQNVMKKEEEKRKEAEEEINRLRENVTKAKNNRAKAEKELKEKVEKAKLEKESLIRRKRKEYNDKLEAAKKEEEENRKKLAELKKRQETKYGTDFLKKVDIAKGAWYEKQAAERASWEGVQWVYRQKCAANWFTVGYWAARLEAAKAAHEIVKAATDVYHESAKGLEATANSDAFQTLVKGIEEAQKGVERAVNGVDSLLRGGGFDGFVRAFVDTEEAKIEAAMKDLRAMQSENSEYQKAIRKAQAILDKKGPELEREIAEADEAIKRIKEDAELAKLQRDYEYQLKVHDEVHNVIEQMQAGLEMLKNNWQEGMHELEKVVDEIQKAISSVFHIEKIEVGAHTHTLVNDKPLVFKFFGTVANKRFEISAEWAPGKALKDLYKAVTNEILKIA